MAMRKLSPVAISDDVMQQLESQVGSQTASREVPKSRDPINFPVFKIPLMGKRFIYVPNHTWLDEEGVAHLRMEKPVLHSLVQGERFMTVRCSSDLNIPQLGYTGSCPFCDVVDIGWGLANEIIDNKCKQAGLNPDDKENKMVASIRSTAYSERAVKDKEQHYTFPIVVFDTDDSCKEFLKDKDGNIQYTIMWYCISERQYNKTWKKTLESLEDEPTHPGGRFFLLNYQYDTKGKEPTIRDSAGALTVMQRSKEALNDFKDILDKATEEWTPAKARVTVITNEFYMYNDLADLAEETIAPSRNLYEVYKAQKMGAAGGEISQVTGGGFNLTKADTESAPATPVDMGATDLDMQ